MAANARGDAAARPSPELSAGDALAAVLRALAASDRPEPGHGAAVLYSFASERMRSAIGDRDAFERALRNDLYAPLVDAAHTETLELERRGDSARGVVAAHTGRGGPVRFTVALARAPRGDRRGCWLFSGIAREGVDL